MQIVVHNPQTVEDAKRRVEAAIVAALADVQDLQRGWEGDSMIFSMRVDGKFVSGQVSVTSSDVSVTLTLPFIAVFAKHRIEERVQKALTDALQS